MNSKIVLLLFAAKLALIVFLIAPPKHFSWGEFKLFAKGESRIQIPDAKDPEKRSRVLADLLDLPKIDPEKSKKEELERYLQMAEAVKQQIADKTKSLEQREQKLTQVEATIDQKLKALEEERNFFIQSVQKEKDIQEERLKILVDVYTKMEPKKAAPVFETLDKDLTVAIFKRLKEKLVTQIIEAMSPDQSKAITEYFARVGSAREYDLLKEMNVSLQQAFQECKASP